ncbi:MAG: DUF4388 domain-containing protein, partial [Actinobacteria bacterium]|nr:DUF4388 domain-containing protein [Actinomycetota bacterium]
PMYQVFHPPAEVIVSLQGSLDSFALPDVLVLLSSTKKDGELRVTGGRVDGRVWLEKGQVVHTEISGKDASAIDAVFELLRLENGTFSFQAEGTAPRRAAPVTIDSVLADAQVRLGEWAEISRVVPHLDAVVDMAAEAPADEVNVTRDQWHLLRTVAGGRSVSELMATLGRSEFDTCKTVKQLIDYKLASIDVKPAGRPARQPAGAAPASGTDQAPARAAAAAPAPAPTAAGRAAAAPAPAERSAPTATPHRQGPPVREPVGEPGNDREAAKAGAAAVAAVGNELEALAELASRPRKVRSTTSDATDSRTDRPTSRLAPTKPGGYSPEPDEEPKSAEEAKALVAQLAALGGDDEEKVAQKVAEHLASGGELPDVPEGDEPINRGLLLKFLSSVRN